MESLFFCSYYFQHSTKLIIFLHIFVYVCAFSKTYENQPIITNKRKIEVVNSCLFDPSKSFDEQTTDEPRMIQLLADDETGKYPLLDVQCSNEFMIVDIDREPNWKKYLTSHRLFHYGIIGPERDDHVNWRDWMIPGMDQFIVSPDCRTCDARNELMDIYHFESAYYMTPVMAGCTQLPVGRIGCDMDFYSYECRVCATFEYRNDGYWTSKAVYNGLNDDNSDIIHNFHENSEEWKYGNCGFTIRNAFAEHSALTDTFARCKNVTLEDTITDAIMPHRKPSLGINGQFCMCIKSTEDKYTEYEVIADDVISDINGENDGKKEENKKNVYHYLYQTHFEDGTFRITEDGGTYILMENIIFDFRGRGYEHGQLNTYNGKNDWWPTSEDTDKYPGAGGLKDPYFLGFFAGVAIEADSIVFDLNGYKMSMSPAYYYQQAFFAIIALTSQPFLPGQGAGFFGASPKAATNTVVRNGEIGLSSHHGIQGYFNRNLLLEDLKVYDFKTHGMQLNGFTDVTIKNCDIGPNHFIDLLTPYYAQHRHYLPNFRSVSELSEVKNLCWAFYGRQDCTTMSALVDDVQLLLDMAFEAVLFDKDWDAIFEDVDDNDLEMKHRQSLWEEYADILLNIDHQHPQTASLYGMFFNYQGSNVIGWYAGTDSVASHGLTLENVEIHDLKHNTYENIAFSPWGDEHQRILGCLNEPFNAYHVFGEEQVKIIAACIAINAGNTHHNYCADVKSTLTYVGNIFVDIQLFHLRLIYDGIISWDYCVSGAADALMVVDFAFKNKYFGKTVPMLAGSHDPMFHPGKGVIALRLNGVHHAILKNVKISRIQSFTGKGSTIAGNYAFVVSQQLPYLSGFSMNSVNALSLTFSKDVVFDGITIDHIYSDTGLVYGVALWYASYAEIKDGTVLKISDIYAGKKTDTSDYDMDDDEFNLPNKIPEACAIRIYGDDVFNPEILYKVDDQIDLSCIRGVRGCITSYDYSMIGDAQPSCTGLQSEKLDSMLVFQYQLFNFSHYYIWLFILFLVILAIAGNICCRSKKEQDSNVQMAFLEI